MRRISALLALMALGACAGRSEPAREPPDARPAPEILESSLPQISELARRSANVSSSQNGVDAMEMSAGALADGNSLVLSASEDIQWAIYSLDCGCDLIDSLSLQTVQGHDAWLGFANFARGAWDWQEISGSASEAYVADSAKTRSTNNRFYCAVVVPKGFSATVNTVSFSLRERYTMPAKAAGIVGTGRWTQILDLGELPAIVYWEPQGDDLCYVRALDSCGTVWSEPIKLDTQGHTGRYLSAALINGRPAVAYFDFTKTALRYIRALDPLGDSWTSGQSIVFPAPGGEYCCLASIAGQPAIAYQNDTEGGLDYIRAIDADGVGWGAQHPLARNVAVNSEVRMLEIEGKPAVAYSSSTPWSLRYVYGKDAEGLAWEDPVELSAEPVVDLNSMFLLDGKPTLCFSYGNPTEVALIGAGDQLGAGWNTAIPIPQLITADWIRAAEYGGLPVVTTAGEGVSLYRANDAAGTSWQEPQALDLQFGPGSAATDIRIFNGALTVSYTSSDELRFITGL